MADFAEDIIFFLLRNFGGTQWKKYTAVVREESF